MINNNKAIREIKRLLRPYKYSCKKPWANLGLGTPHQRISIDFTKESNGQWAVVMQTELGLEVGYRVQQAFLPLDLIDIDGFVPIIKDKIENILDNIFKSDEIHLFEGIKKSQEGAVNE